mmetsp:Transcript_11620/g.71469  ORF Transcript_11620/g.71469 Transcript_11620/m.71469 type:complete len:235 (-) Transcript_11620:185-889(-)
MRPSAGILVKSSFASTRCVVCSTTWKGWATFLECRHVVSSCFFDQASFFLVLLLVWFHISRSPASTSNPTSSSARESTSCRVCSACSLPVSPCTCSCAFPGAVCPSRMPNTRVPCGMPNGVRSWLLPCRCDTAVRLPAGRFGTFRSASCSRGSTSCCPRPYSGTSCPRPSHTSSSRQLPRPLVRFASLSASSFSYACALVFRARVLCRQDTDTRSVWFASNDTSTSSSTGVRTA